MHLRAGHHNVTDVVRREFTVFVPQVFPKFLKTPGGINELDFSFFPVCFIVGQQPDIGGDSGVVKQIVGQLDDGFQQVVFNDVAADIAFTASRIPGEQTGPVMN